MHSRSQTAVGQLLLCVCTDSTQSISKHPQLITRYRRVSTGNGETTRNARISGCYLRPGPQFEIKNAGMQLSHTTSISNANFQNRVYGFYPLQHCVYNAVTSLPKGRLSRANYRKSCSLDREASASDVEALSRWLAVQTNWLPRLATVGYEAVLYKNTQGTFEFGVLIWAGLSSKIQSWGCGEYLQVVGLIAMTRKAW